MNRNTTLATTKNAVSDITNKPLTREEMATYMDYLTTKTKEQNEIITSALENLKDTYNKKIDKLCDSIADNIAMLVKAQMDNGNSIDSLRKSMFVISKNISPNNTANVEPQKKCTNPKFVNSMNVNDVRKWISEAWNSCDLIGKKCGKSKLQILRDVYKQIREIESDFDATYNEYKEATSFSNPSIINMIGYSDYYRPIVEKIIKQLYNQYYHEKTAAKSKQKYLSEIMQHTPDNVRVLVSAYAKKHDISNCKASRSLFSKLRNSCGLNFDKAKEDYLNTIGYSRCTPAYFISNTPALMNMLERIAEE